MLPMHTIIHPTDFSKPSDNAFRLACSLARDHGARVIFFHVAPPIVAYGDIVRFDQPEIAREKLWEAFRQLQESDPKVRELHVETQLAVGEPVQEILRLAKESKCDLIVMGTHGRTGLRRLLMGSVAEQIVRKAPCPVLTVKTPFPQARMAEEKIPEHEAVMEATDLPILANEIEVS